MAKPPALADVVIRRLLQPSAAHDVIGDLHEEYLRFMLAELGPTRASIWYWYQAIAALAHCGAFRLALTRRLTQLREVSATIVPRAYIGLTGDIRDSLRGFVASPGIAATIVLTFAVGTGVTSAAFSAVNGVLLQPLPYERPQDLVVVGAPDQNADRKALTATAPEFRLIRGRACSLKDVAASWPTDANLTGDGNPVRLSAALVTHNLFSLLGVAPALGRDFRPDDANGGVGYVVILSHAAWQREFDSRADLVGQQVFIDSDAMTVVGVMPEDFHHPFEGPGQPVDAWVPLDLSRGSLLDGPRSRVLKLIGRLEEGSDVHESRAELARIAEEYRSAHPADYSDDGALTLSATTLRDEVVGDAGTVLLPMLVAVALVFLAVVTNLCSLQFSRGAARVRQLAVRAALGASRRRIAQKLVVESLLFVLVGGVAGLGVAVWGSHVLRSAMSRNLPRLDNIEVDGVVVAFLVAISLMSVLALGWLPAARLSRASFKHLFDRNGGVGGSAHHTTRNLLIGLQVASSLVLLVGAGLLVKSYNALVRVDLGFDAERVLTLDTWLPVPNDPAQGRYSQPSERIALFDSVLGEMSRLPGVTYAGMTSLLPLRGFLSRPVQLEASSQVEESIPYTVQDKIVSEHYFDALGIDIVDGRVFERDDTLGGPQVAVVNRALVDQLGHGANLLGRRLGTGSPGRRWAEIVGIVADVSHDEFGGPARPTVYHSFRQVDRAVVTMSFVLKTIGRPESLADSATSALHRADRDLPAFSVASLTSLVAGVRASRRILAGAFALFGLQTLILAALGIYGVVSYSVTCRTREIGIRLALGGARLGVLRMLMGEGLRMGIVGCAAGLVAAFVLYPALDKALFDVQPLDTGVFAAATGCALVMVLVASMIPALAAMRLAPVKAINTN